MIVRYTLKKSSAVTSKTPSTPDVAQCDFEFDVEVVKTAANLVAGFPQWRAPRGNGAPIVNTWRRHHPHRLLEWIDQQNADVLDMNDSQWRSWRDVFDFLIADRRFRTVTCECCAATYGPHEISLEWYERQDGPRAAIGGNRYVCPAGHCLYFRAHWIS